MVVLVTGFSFLGYVANRIFGERHGTIATALIGGVYSSTAVTQALAQRLGSEQEGGAEPAGIALATGVMYLRIPVLIAVLATRVLVPITMILLPALVVAWGAGFWLYSKAPKADAPKAAPAKTEALLPAVEFLAFVAIPTVAAKWAQGGFGQAGSRSFCCDRKHGRRCGDHHSRRIAGGRDFAVTCGHAICGTVIVLAVKSGSLVYARRKAFLRDCDGVGVIVLGAIWLAWIGFDRISGH